MGTHAAIAVGLILYVVLTTGVSFLMMSRVRKPADYLVAGRGLPFWVLTGTIMAVLDSSIVNVALPSMSGTLGVTGAATLSSTLGVTGNTTVAAYSETVVAIGTVTTTNTLSIAAGTVQTATLTASTACTFTMPTATAGKSFILLLKQAATTGNGTATFTSVKWNSGGTPTVTATAGKMDIFTFVADGTNWYGSACRSTRSPM